MPDVFRNGMGNRQGPRFSVGWTSGVSCDWPAVKEGVLIVDNHGGLALGRVYLVAPDDATAVEAVRLLTAGLAAVQAAADLVLET